MICPNCNHEFEPQRTAWLYSIEEVMKIFNVSKVTLWRWRQEGKLKPVRGVTSKTQYLAQEVEELKTHILEFSGKYEYVQEPRQNPQGPATP